MDGPSRSIVIAQASLEAGGAEKIVRLLASHLDARGHRVTVLSVKGHPGQSFYAFPASVAVRTMEAELGGAATRATWRRVLWLRRVIREAEAELAVSFLTKINVQVAAATLGLGLRRVASERNNFQRQRMSPLWRWLMPVTLATADGAVLLTRAARDALPAWARRRAVVIQNPVPQGIRPFAGPVPPRHLVAVGRLTEQKGFDVLIRAVDAARRRGCDLDLTIHGEGEDRASLARLIEALGLSGRIRLPGRTERPHDWTGRGGIFVLSSRYEGFANVLVEAMAAGFAVVATDCPWGPAEIITHGRDGLLVPPDDPDRLAEALVRVASDDALRADLARAAVRRAADFTEPRILSEWDAVLARALGADAVETQGPEAGSANRARHQDRGRG